MSIALAVGLLTAASVYLFMQRGMIRIVLGFVLISHAANLLLFSAGNTAFRGIPYIGEDPNGQADPLPQAFVLTAIVIAFSITMYMVTLAITTSGDDDTEDEEESAVTAQQAIARQDYLAQSDIEAPELEEHQPVHDPTARSGIGRGQNPQAPTGGEER